MDVMYPVIGYINNWIFQINQKEKFRIFTSNFEIYFIFFSFFFQLTYYFKKMCYNNYFTEDSADLAIDSNFIPKKPRKMYAHKGQK